MEKSVYDKYKSLREAKKREWKRIGYSPSMIEAAAKRAEDWVQELTRKLIGKHPHITARYPGIIEDVQDINYPSALEDSGKYLAEYYRAFAPRKEKELSKVT